MCAAGNKKANWFLSAAGNSKRATPSSRWADVCNVCSGGREGRPGQQDCLACCTGTTWGITTSPSPWTHGRKGWGSRCISLAGPCSHDSLPPCSRPPWTSPTCAHVSACWICPAPALSAHGTASLTSGNGLLLPQNLRFLGQVPSTVFYSCPLATGKSM